MAQDPAILEKVNKDFEKQFEAVAFRILSMFFF